MEQAIVKYHQWQPTKQNSLATVSSLNGLLISGSQIDISTSQEDCIKQDLFQLSAMVIRKEETVKEQIEVTVGNFIGTGIIVKSVPTLVDKTHIQKVIELMVIEIFEWFAKEVSVPLIKQLAVKIYEDYYWLKFAELKLFAERMKGGYWKQMHNLSPAVLMERLADFCEESLAIREQLSHMQTEKSKEIILPLDEKQKLQFNEFAGRVAEKLKVLEQKDANDLQQRMLTTKKWHDDNKFCVEWCKRNKLTGDEMLAWYETFLLRKQ